MTPLPLSVIGGFLGAGKTTLINRLLIGEHGLRLAVLVNDFGAINIDAALLASASEDTIELTNGCVCCTMTGDLFFAIGDMLDRRPRPDHLIVEASGIANPARIAAVALAEKDLSYAGIITLVDGVNIGAQLSDARISAQVREQLDCADLLAVSKAQVEAPEVVAALRGMTLANRVGADAIAPITALMFGRDVATGPVTGTDADHPDYVQWATTGVAALSKSALMERLRKRPKGLLRLKALVPSDDGRVWEVHVVGSQQSVVLREPTGKTGVVAIGLKEPLSAKVIEEWWHGD